MSSATRSNGEDDPQRPTQWQCVQDSRSDTPASTHGMQEMCMRATLRRRGLSYRHFHGMGAVVEVVELRGAVVEVVRHGVDSEACLDERAQDHHTTSLSTVDTAKPSSLLSIPET